MSTVMFYETDDIREGTGNRKETDEEGHVPNVPYVL